MIFTAKERAGFARHENEQRRHEAALSLNDRLAMLAQMQRTAALFGHGQHGPSPASQQSALPSHGPDSSPAAASS